MNERGPEGRNRLPASAGAHGSKEGSMSSKRVHVVFVRLALALSCLASLTQSAVAQSQQITSPDKFFGFQMGADRKLARWDKLVAYYKLLEQQSSKIKVVDMGPTTMGNPFLVLFISSPA